MSVNRHFHNSRSRMWNQKVRKLELILNLSNIYNYLLFNVWFFICIGRRLYQCNEGDFYIFLANFFQITSLQLNKKKLLIDRISLFPCLYPSLIVSNASMLITNLKIQTKIESCLLYWYIRRRLNILDMDRWSHYPRI